MIQQDSRVRIRPDNLRLREMLRIQPNDDVTGKAIKLYLSPPQAHDVRPRWCVRLDVDYYGLFYEHEIEVL